MTAPARQRVSVQSDRKMVTLRGQIVPVEVEPTTLYGWTVPVGGVLCVVLDDGRELLVAAKDVSEVA
jgi:hypothetical protein